MKPGEIRDKTAAELSKVALELEEELFRLRFRKGAGNLKQTANIRKTKCDLARVLTIRNEKGLRAEKEGLK